MDLLVSILQKEIRRSNVDNAVLAAYEMLSTSEEVAEHLWRRLKIIAVEDIGMGEPLAPVLLNALHENYRNMVGGEQTMMAIHGVRLLAKAKKDRTSSEHTELAAYLVESGTTLVEVPDYAKCVHTKAGQEMGRGIMHWWEHGAPVADEIAEADHTYREKLLEICRTMDGFVTAN